MKKIKYMIGTVLLFIGASAFAEDTCPTDALLLSPELIEGNLGYVEFIGTVDSISSEAALEGRIYTANGCFLTPVFVTQVDGFALAQLSQKAFFLDGLSSLLTSCSDAGVKKYYKAGEIKSLIGSKTPSDIKTNTMLSGACY